MAVGPRARGHLVMGVPRGAFRPSAAFLCLVAISVAGGVMAWRGYGNMTVDVLLLVVGGWLVSLCLHEYAHALLAYRSGDVGVAARGYLTLDPFKYTHPLLSIVFPVVALMMGGIGLPGGAVWVDRHAVRGRLTHTVISAAGPTVNVACTFVLVIPFWLDVDTSAHPDFWAGMAFLCLLQLTASLLNLVPIPGVDGGNLVRPWLPAGWQRGFDTIAPFGMLILLAVLLRPEGARIFFDVVDRIADLIGLPRGLADDGYRLIRFW